MIKVIKRDGKVVEFNKDKIINAITKAMQEVGEFDLKLAEKIANEIENSSNKTTSVSTIEETVEDKLMSSKMKKVARAYIRYRFRQEERRNVYSEIDKEMQGLKDLSSEEIRNNANKAGDKLQTYRAMVADITCKNYAERHILPQRLLKHHGKEFYVHDENYLDVPMFNCCLINWIDMLENGFVIGNAPIEKPKSITTAINLLSQIVSHVSSNCYGGITLISLTKGLCQYAVASLDKHLIDAKEWVSESKREEYAWKMLEKEIKNAFQGLEYEIQTLTTSRGEVPFVTEEIDCVDLNASEKEQRIQKMIIKSLLNTRLKGLTGGITPVFPKMCFELQRGNNLEITDPYYDLFKLAVKCSSVRLYPDYLMHDKIVEVTGNYKPPMGCRNFPTTHYNDDGSVLIGGAFNQGACSVNLPRLAIQSNHNVEDFYKRLEEAMYMCKDVLMIRHNKLKEVKVSQAPILYQYGAIARMQPDETIEKLLYKDKSTISVGYVGLYNAMVALYGEGYENKIKEAESIIQFMKDKLQEWTNETNMYWSIYSTPAETLASKFCEQDIKDFGIVKGVNDNKYYENSFHYPSLKEILPFDKIDIESNFSKKVGSSIQYVEFGSMIHNTEALETIIRYAYDKCHYFGVNVDSDRCFECGYVGEMTSLDKENSKYKCPQCGNEDNTKMSVIRRLCGYLGSLSERPSAKGKMRETNNRVKHFKG